MLGRRTAPEPEHKKELYTGVLKSKRNQTSQQLREDKPDQPNWHLSLRG